MRIFDRLRSALFGEATSEQEALSRSTKDILTRKNGRYYEVIQYYLEAIRLAQSMERAHLNQFKALLAKNDLKGAPENYITLKTSSG